MDHVVLRKDELEDHA